MVQKTDEEIKEIYDKITDWEDTTKFNGWKYSPDNDLYYCPFHKMIMSPQGAGNHGKKCMADRNVSSQQTKKELGDLGKPKKPEDVTTVPTPGAMILEDVNKEISEAAGMLAKDYELKAVYEILRFKNHIPWDWSFYDWMKIGCYQYWAAAFGYELELTQNESILSNDQTDWIKSVIKENLLHEKQMEAKQ